MKKIAKRIVVFLLAFIVLGVMIYFCYKKEINFYINKAVFHYVADMEISENPIIWNNIKIKYPEWMGYRITKRTNGESLLLCSWMDVDEANNAITFASNNFPEDKMNRLIDKVKKDNLSIVSINTMSFKGYDAQTMKFISKDDLFNYFLFVKERDLLIIFQGIEDRFEVYKNIINEIEFL